MCPTQDQEAEPLLAEEEEEAVIKEAEEATKVVKEDKEDLDDTEAEEHLFEEGVDKPEDIPEDQEYSYGI